MILEYSRQLIAIAVILLLLGCIMPFLMVISVVESTIFLNFFSFGASVLGLFLGVAGIAGEKLKKEKHADPKDRYR